MLSTFVDRVRDVAESGREDHRHVIAALEALEEALVILGGDAVARPRMRHEIEALGGSPVASSLHADHVRMALQMAVVTSLGAEPRRTRDRAGYKLAVAAFVEAVERIDPERPLLQQHAQVREALVLAADMLHVAIGLRSPLHPRPRTTRHRPRGMDGVTATGMTER